MKEEVYEPMKPSLVLTATNGNVKVTTKLYGPVTPERASREQLTTKHRAAQLNLDKIEKIERVDEENAPGPAQYIY